jgi:hypothetical protein
MPSAYCFSGRAIATKRAFTTLRSSTHTRVQKDTAAILDDPSDRDSGLDELRPVITPKELR